MADKIFVVVVLFLAALIPVVALRMHAAGRRSDLQALQSYASSRGFFEVGTHVIELGQFSGAICHPMA